MHKGLNFAKFTAAARRSEFRKNLREIPAWGNRPCMGPAAQRARLGACHHHEPPLYADAQRRGNPITLLVTETTGAMSPTLCAALRETGKAVAPAHRVPKNGMLSHFGDGSSESKQGRGDGNPRCWGKLMPLARSSIAPWGPF